MVDFSTEITVTNPKTLQQNWNYLLILRGSEADMDNPNREPLDGVGVEFNPQRSASSRLRCRAPALRETTSRSSPSTTGHGSS